MRKHHPNIEGLLEEVTDLFETEKLLEEIWKWYGPYGPRSELLSRKEREEVRESKVCQKLLKELEMPTELRMKLQNHFEFDDSE